MSAMEAKTRDDGKQKVDSKPSIENRPGSEGKAKSSKLVMVVGLVLGLLLAGGGGWAYMHFKGAGAAAAHAKEKAQSEAKPEVKSVMPLDPFLVNLADIDQVRFLKATFQLGIGEEPKEESAANVAEAAMRDSIISLLSSKTAEQILTTQGKDKLREEIRARINRISPEMKVVEVYIVDFVVQL